MNDKIGPAETANLAAPDELPHPVHWNTTLMSRWNAVRSKPRLAWLWTMSEGAPTPIQVSP